jgi:hypothetical protein
VSIAQRQPNIARIGPFTRFVTQLLPLLSEAHEEEPPRPRVDALISEHPTKAPNRVDGHSARVRASAAILTTSACLHSVHDERDRAPNQDREIARDAVADREVIYPHLINRQAETIVMKAITNNST